MEIIEIGKEQILRVQEHECFPLMEKTDSGVLALLKAGIVDAVPTADMSAMRLMNMDYKFRGNQFCMDYYIGADWIDRKKNAVLEVLPKIGNIDFQQMLMKCFEHPEASEDLDELFFIRAEDKPVCLPSDDFQLEPLVVIYFLNLVSIIVKKGLRSNFVAKEERLNGRIKGKILMSRYMKHGFANNRKDLVDCRFDEYDVDCVDNRILKKALLITESMVESTKTAWGRGMYAKLKDMLKFCLPAFEHVSPEVSVSEVQHIHVSPLFGGYRPAMNMAKTIIRKQGVGISQYMGDGTMMVPPFIINMPLLFERYVYALLCDRYGQHGIEYQTGTRLDRPDFLKTDEMLIMDTKYITTWETGVITDNIRQMAGYSRSRGVRAKLGVTDDYMICPCLVIYPRKDGLHDFNGCGYKLFDDDKAVLIKDYIGFKKIGIRLPST